MKVRILTTYAGPKGNFAANTVCEVEDEMAMELIEIGAAKFVSGAPVKEKPTVVIEENKEEVEIKPEVNIKKKAVKKSPRKRVRK